MKGERGKLYESAEDFFELEGSVVMKLTPSAAISVCQQAAKRGLIVARIEGGIWHYPGFESRLDCIWDGADPPIDTTSAHENNLLAAEFIESEIEVHDVFILTAPPITGWPHENTEE